MAKVRRKKKSSRSGTTKVQGTHWLKDNRPDLLEKVHRGVLSVHAAMVEAGARPRLVSVPLDKDYYDRVELLARAEGISVSRFCRREILKALGE